VASGDGNFNLNFLSLFWGSKDYIYQKAYVQLCFIYELRRGGLKQYDVISLKDAFI
jgi:hypothetical protein